MNTFELTKEQLEKAKEYLNERIKDYELDYITISLEPVKDKENQYYIKTKTKAKEFTDISILFDELNATVRIELDTENFIFSEIYK